jgi:large subunit ribosomal protein L31
MKQGIHPEYHEITIVQTDGTKYKTRSTWGKPGAEMILLVDNLSHPAYTGKRRVIDTAGRVDKFNKRYGVAAPAAAEAGK